MHRICPRRSGGSLQKMVKLTTQEEKQMTVALATDASSGTQPLAARVWRLSMSSAKVTLPLPPVRISANRFELLEPYEGKLSRTVLRGAWAGDSLRLPA
jgi:hypothetical protein